MYIVQRFLFTVMDFWLPTDGKPAVSLFFIHSHLELNLHNLKLKFIILHGPLKYLCPSVSERSVDLADCPLPASLWVAGSRRFYRHNVQLSRENTRRREVGGMAWRDQGLYCCILSIRSLFFLLHCVQPTPTLKGCQTWWLERFFILPLLWLRCGYYDDQLFHNSPLFLFLSVTAS